MIEISAPGHISKARILLSGSKSISNRLMILNKVLDANTILETLSGSEDTKLLQNVLNQIERTKKATLDVHHAGTDFRFLTALLAITEGEWLLTGSERMKERPVGELVIALRSLGADIMYAETENFPPLKINGKNLRGGNVEIDGSISSQFVSALLLISPALENGLALTLKGDAVSRPYIDMTIALLRSYGIVIEEKQNCISVIPHSVTVPPALLKIESDWSSASYWYSICALTETEIELAYLSEKSLQADSVLPEIYRELGVNTEFNGASVVLRSIRPLVKEFSFDFINCPDIAQTVAVTCFALGIPANLKGLKTLRVKETDRIHALKTELERLGAIVHVTTNEIRIEPGTGNPKPGTRNREHETRNIKDETLYIRTYNDHRMAMSFAPLALKYSQLQIEDPSVVDKSYPGFWDDLKSVGFSVNLQPR